MTQTEEINEWMNEGAAVQGWMSQCGSNFCICGVGELLVDL
ncbi:hypothetical protein [Blautia sp.]|nr:hypothetical protein [Blautia sp.]